MTASRIVNIVGTDCPQNEAKLDKWYNEVHVPMLFKYKGMKKVTRAVDKNAKKGVKKIDKGAKKTWKKAGQDINKATKD